MVVCDLSVDVAKLSIAPSSLSPVGVIGVINSSENGSTNQMITQTVLMHTIRQKKKACKLSFVTCTFIVEICILCRDRLPVIGCKPSYCSLTQHLVYSRSFHVLFSYSSFAFYFRSGLILYDGLDIAYNWQSKRTNGIDIAYSWESKRTNGLDIAYNW